MYRKMGAQSDRRNADKSTHRQGCHKQSFGGRRERERKTTQDNQTRRRFLIVGCTGPAIFARTFVHRFLAEILDFSGGVCQRVQPSRMVKKHGPWPAVLKTRF